MASLIRTHLIPLLMIDLGCRDGMYVVAMTESVEHCLVIREIRHKTQLYLGIVCRKEEMTIIRDKRTADLLPSSSLTGMF